MRYAVLFIVVLLGTVSWSCEKSDPVAPVPFPPPPSVTGLWRSPFGIEFYVTESDGRLKGAGSIYGALGLSVTGQNKYPFVVISIGSQGYIPATIRAKFVARDSLEGLINGSGFDNIGVQFKRESP